MKLHSGHACATHGRSSPTTSAARNGLHFDVFSIDDVLAVGGAHVVHTDHPVPYIINLINELGDEAGGNGRWPPLFHTQTGAPSL